ncbi:MAG: hypothetical protein IKJ87_06960 [Ruminococcus sp.]|nr:hypothetical protein [Ruminococcus sp.]
MKTKKILAALFSAVTAISAVSPVISNALHPWGKVPSLEEFADYDPINVDSPLAYKCSYKPSNYEDVYTDAFLNKYLDIYGIVYVERPHSRIEFSVSEYDENLLEKIKEINPNSSFKVYKTDGKETYRGSVSNPVDEEAKKICELLGDKIVTFEYKKDMRNYYTSNSKFTEFHYTTEETPNSYNVIENPEEVKGKIENYIKENNLNFELTFKEYKDTPLEKSGMINIVPKDDITPLEHFKITNDICTLTGLEPEFYIYESTSKSTKGTTLDLTNYLNGDSNCDKKQTIADAVAILQYLGNPDDYPLSELGAFNADSDNNGITADDAVRIQQKDAGIL